jgi:uncharacterized membrane protein
MATLTVWTFDSATGANDALEKVKTLRQQQLLELQDAAIVTWPADAKKPSIRQLHDVVGAGVLGGAFWGLLFGLLFFVPLLGAAIGAGLGALVAHTTDVGIDDNTIKQLRDKITPGTSALFVLTANVVIDRVLEDLETYKGHVELVQSNLSHEQEEKLRAMFGPVREPAAAEPESAVGEPESAALNAPESPVGEPESAAATDTDERHAA